jgi:hypothetical protein
MAEITVEQQTATSPIPVDNDDIITGVHESQPLQPLDQETFDLTSSTDLDPIHAAENETVMQPGRPQPRQKRTFTEDGFKKSELVRESAKILLPMFSGRSVTAAGSADPMQLEQDGVEGKTLLDPDSMSDDELGEWALDFMGWFNYHMPSMAMNVNRIKTGDTRQKMALFYLMQMYDDKEMTWDGVWRGVKGIISDPSTYVGLSTLGIGTVVGASVKAASRTSVKAALKASLGPILAGSAEAGVYTGTDDALRQAVSIMAGAQEGFDPVRSAVATTIGAVAGGGLTAAVSAAPPVVKKAVAPAKGFVQRLFGQ